MKSLLVALALLLSSASLAGAACDPTTMSGILYYTDADSVVTMDQYGSVAYKEGFDFPTGRIFAYCSGYSICKVPFMNFRGSDVYRIQGAPAGVPIILHVELQIDATIGGTYKYPECGVCNTHTSDFYASIRDSKGDYDSVAVCLCWQEPTRTIGFNTEVMPDEELSVGFGIQGYAGAGGPNYGDLQARIRFAGVPAGAQLISCHGVDEQAVATKPLTWGRLKASYR